MRLLPRLLPALRKSRIEGPDWPTFIPPAPLGRRKRRSLYRPPEPAPVDAPPPVFASHGRVRSVLLDTPNAVASRARHKRTPPWARLAYNQRRPQKQSEDGNGEWDPARLMSDKERGWWSSPYLRMLASPVRQERLTERVLPADFLIRLGALKLPASRAAARAEYMLVPDGLQHPKYAGRRASVSMYILCRHDALGMIPDRGTLPKTGIPNLRSHPALGAQIGHALRLRVLQELSLLSAGAACAPRGAHGAPMLRRLVREEFSALRAGRPFHDPGAVALLVVPPVNRDPRTRARVVPASDSDASPPAVEQTPAPKRPPLPLSTLHPLADGFVADGAPSATSDEQPVAKLPPAPRPCVPLYNGATLFPSRAQRAALHAALCNLLLVERRARWRGTEAPASADTDSEDTGRARGDRKASHAFLLRSDAATARRADAVPLAIALWRLRMWEGDACATGAPSWDVVL